MGGSYYRHTIEKMTRLHGQNLYKLWKKYVLRFLEYAIKSLHLAGETPKSVDFLCLSLFFLKTVGRERRDYDGLLQCQRTSESWGDQKVLSQGVHFTIEVALCVEQTVLKGSAIRYFVGHLSHIRMILRTSAIVGRPEVLLVLAR